MLLTGIHLMRSGAVESNLVLLNEEAKLPYIDELVERKVNGPEQGQLDQADLEIHSKEFERLRSSLEQAYAESTLPESPIAAKALNDLLVRVRLDGRED